MNSKELENRLIDFSIRVVNLIKSLPGDRVTNHNSQIQNRRSQINSLCNSASRANYSFNYLKCSVCSA